MSDATAPLPPSRGSLSLDCDLPTNASGQLPVLAGVYQLSTAASNSTSSLCPASQQTIKHALQGTHLPRHSRALRIIRPGRLPSYEVDSLHSCQSIRFRDRTNMASALIT